ncbi:MAG: hypothetical protein H6575_09105 [Lewinellaceae bacterium]|nr:hypothetical protein [Lewinellaceae bacterium]
MRICWLIPVLAAMLQTGTAQQSCAQLFLSNEPAMTGDTVAIRLTVRGFADIASYQFAMRWNPDDLKFLQHSAAASPLPFQLFNAGQATQGKFISIWSDVNAVGVTLPDDALLFEMKFRVLAQTSGYYPVAIDPEVSPVFEMTVNSKGLPLAHAAGGVRIGASTDFGVTSICASPPPCNAPLGAIKVTLEGGVPPYSYNWEGPNGYFSDVAEPDNLVSGVYQLTASDAQGNILHAVAGIPYVYSSVHVTAVSKNAVCSQPNGCLDLNVSGGVEPYTFEWSLPGNQEEDRCDLPPGYYTIKVTDAVGCAASGYYHVGNDSALAVTTTVAHADCRFDTWGSAVVQASGQEPYTYHWSNGASTATAETLAPGIYHATVSDANGCDAVVPVEIKDYGTFDWSLNLVATCIGDDSSRQLRLTGYDFAYRAAFPLLLHWSNGTIQEVVSVDDNTVSPLISELRNIPSGEYSVTLVDADGCSAVTDAALTCEPLIMNGAQQNPIFKIDGNYSNGLNGCAKIYAKNIDHVREIHFSLRWRSDWMELKEIKDFFPLMGIGASNFTSTPGWVDFDWTSPSPEGFSYPYEFPLFKVCYQDQTTNKPLLDFARHGNKESSVVHATDGNLGFIGKCGVVYFAYGLLSDPVIDFNLAPPSCASDGFARVQMTTYDNVKINPYASLQFEEFYSSYPAMKADTLLFAAPGAFNFRSTIPGYSIPSRFFVQIPQYDLPAEECVWPGDTDNNGVVNHFDLLYLGLGMGSQGIARSDTAMEWLGYDCADWPFYTATRHIGFKNMDTNGDGLIDPFDTTGIFRHWGRSIRVTESKPCAMPATPDTIDVESILTLAADTLPGGKTISIPVKLNLSGMQNEPVLGLAFSISYDPAVVVSEVRFEPQPSWLGAPGIDLLDIQKDFQGQRRLDVSLVRMDGTGVTGSGPIGDLVLQLENPLPGEIISTPFFTSNVLLVTPEERLIGLQEQRIDFLVAHDQSSGVSGADLSAFIQLTPNPAGAYIHIESLRSLIYKVEISTMSGVLLRSFGQEATTTMALPLDDLPASTCIARIFTDSGVVVKKFVIAR